MEQALADYATLIGSLQVTLAAANGGARVPFVALGGSYGGMLAAWLRREHPSLVFAALASSAPVLGGALSTDLFLRRARMRQAPHLESRSRPRGRGLKIICTAATIDSSLP